MKKFIFIVLGVAVLTLQIAKPMTVYWNGRTGEICHVEVYNWGRVNKEQAATLFHISQINSVGAAGMKVKDIPCKENNQTGELEIWW